MTGFLFEYGWWILIGIIALNIYLRNKTLSELHTRIMKPETDEDYLRKLCYISHKNTYEIFTEAAGDNYRFITQDHDRYLKTQTIPGYVVEFINEGKEVIEKAHVSPFTFFGTTGD